MRIVPSATAVGLGAAAAWMRKTDIDKGRTTLSKQYGTYLEFIAAFSGLVGDTLHLGINRDITDALAIGGLTLASERVTRSALTSPAFSHGSPMAINGRSYGGMPFIGGGNGVSSVRDLMVGQPFAQKEASLTLV